MRLDRILLRNQSRTFLPIASSTYFIIFCLVLSGYWAAAQDLLPFQEQGQWGFRTPQGNPVIKPQYQFAKRFKDGYAVVSKDGHVGVIDQSNRQVIPFRYDVIDYLDKDRFVFGYRDTYFGEYRVGVINSANQILLKPQFRSVSLRASCYVVQTTQDSLIQKRPFGDTRAVKSKYGLYDRSGRAVIPCQYDYITWLDDSLLVLSCNNHQAQALYRVTGQALTGFDYRVINAFHEGLAQVVKGRYHGFINKAGELVIPARFELSEPFANGVSMVRYNNQWGAIDKRGQFTIAPTYSFEQVKAQLREQSKQTKE
jgi:hypothetical protein